MKRHPALWLTIFLSFFYILLGNLRIASGDGETMLQVTRALAEKKHLALPPGAIPPVEMVIADSTDTQIAYTLVGHDGQTYSKYGLGQSLVALPLYLLDMIWRSVSGAAHAPRTAALLINSLLTAATAGLLVVLARELEFSSRTGLLLALAYGLCTPAWPYTHTFFSEPLVTFCLTVAALAAVRCSKTGQAGWMLLTGSALGLALLTRINALAALPAFTLYIVLMWRSQKEAPRTVLKQATAGLLGLALAGSLMLLYNIIRTGHPLDFGYYTSNWQTPFLRGFYGLTLSPGKNIFWYAPPIILGILSLPAFSRRHPREATLCAGIVAGYILLHCSYTYWEGGWSWGPRLILPMLPFALLPAGALLSRPTLSKATELGMAALLALGLVVQIPAVGASFAHALQRSYQASPDDFQNRVLFQPAYSPLVGQWQSFLEVTANMQSSAARSQIADLLNQIQPAEALLLTDSPEEALRLERQELLSFNLPDLWLVSASWLREDTSP